MSPGKRRRAEDVVRRRRTARLDLVTVLAVVVPLLTIGILSLVRQPPVHDFRQGPALTELTASTVVCPAATPGSPDASVSTTSTGTGSVSVLSGTQHSNLDLRPGAPAALTGDAAAIVRGAGGLAPGLLGLRSGTSPLTAQRCSIPTADQWFTGLGAGAADDSVIELVNPDSGPANVDVTLYGRRTYVPHKLHGLTVPARRSITLDLGKVAPHRELLSAHVQVTRGRLGVHVLDTRTNLANHKTRPEWLPRQVAPSVTNRLLGLPSGSGTRLLRLVNPGTDVVRAEVKVITGDTAFAPAGLGTVTVPAGATTSVSLTRVLDKALGDGALGIQVTSDGPVAASLLTGLATDQAFTVPDTDIREGAATLLPVASGKGAAPVAATLYLQADAAGSATVTAYDASGARVLDRKVGQQQGHTAAIPLPAGTAFLKVVPEGTVVRGAVMLTGDGASVLPLEELQTRGLVPAIRPGLN